MEPDPARSAGLLGAFRGGLNVQLIPDSQLVQISYTHPDPRLATEIVNGLGKTFIEENFRTKYESVTQTSEWLSTELADLQLKVQTSEEKLVRYQQEHSILGIDDKQNIVTAKLDDLNKELTEAQSDRIQKESVYRFSMSGDPACIRESIPRRLKRAAGQVAGKRGRPRHPVRSVDNPIWFRIPQGCRAEQSAQTGAHGNSNRRKENAGEAPR